ncbi:MULTISPECIES: hypothetical protein [Streptomyces]|uniref:hypothetical protein n=1 Tax=Streptomyces TaxID=1883 RepID=UPI0016712391|nr:hypothetical protein [Streptomyces ruber]
MIELIRSKMPSSSSLAAPSVEVALAVWLVATALSQHPNRSFDGLRRYDPLGVMIPNWRFFAPTPAQHDYHLLYRTLSHDGEQSQWEAASTITPRSWAQSIWSPGRRQEKAVFDLCSELVSIDGHGKNIVETTAYKLFKGFVAHKLANAEGGNRDIRGFQFLIVRYSGHDDSEEPLYSFVSPFIPAAQVG